MTYLPIMYRTPNHVLRTYNETVTYPNGSSAVITYVDWVGYSKSGKATTHLKTTLRVKWLTFYYANTGLVNCR